MYSHSIILVAHTRISNEKSPQRISIEKKKKMEKSKESNIVGKKNQHPK